MPFFIHARLLFACVLSCFCQSSTQAFILSNSDFQPWLTTASGPRSNNGEPVTLTWSFVGDGTSIPNVAATDPNVGSDLISFLDDTFGGNPLGQMASNLTARPWFTLFEQTFDRWAALSGVDYLYEANDDNSILAVASGQLGVRGDIRLGGRNVDGPGSTLAFNYFPNDGDMVIDTSEATFLGNGSNLSRGFRNTLAHELGHGLNLDHVVSSTDALLMEPTIGLSFDGPQLDEVRGVHFFYGDVNEKQHNGLGNDIAARATDLGTVSAGGTVSIGADANVPTQSIGATATDFVSISNLDDADFFSFTITEPSFLDALLTPLGGMFTQGAESETPLSFDANARSDLTLRIFDSSGVTVLATANTAGLGESDALHDLTLPQAGEYFARVTGAADTIQLYQLDLSIDPVLFLAADFNEDFRVDSADLAVWTAAIGNDPFGDADGDGDSDGADFLFWQRQFGSDIGATVTSIATVPEPAGALLYLLGLPLLRCLT